MYARLVLLIYYAHVALIQLINTLMDVNSFMRATRLICVQDIKSVQLRVTFLD